LIPFATPGELADVMEEPVTGMFEHAARAARTAETRRSFRGVFIMALSYQRPIRQR
jgi:hypothetical protein